MEIKCTCGAEASEQRAIQRSGGVEGLDFIRIDCGKCGGQRTFHAQDAREVAAIIDASNEPTKGTHESN